MKEVPLLLNIYYISLIIIAQWSILKTNLTDPGYVPLSSRITLEEFQTAKEEGKFEIHPNVSYCATCEIVKLQRAHHCSKCKRCVLEMDHHCPWYFLFNSYL